MVPPPENEPQQEQRDTSSKYYETIRQRNKNKVIAIKNNLYKHIYIMAEIIANLIKADLVDGLSFKRSKTTTYVTKRKSCTFHLKQAICIILQMDLNLSNVLISINDCFDPSTCHIMFHVRNDGGAGKTLRPI